MIVETVKTPAECADATQFNLFAHRTTGYGEKWFATTEKPRGIFDQLIMPDECGIMHHAAPKGWGWYAIKWPVNPHFTGETGILEMLNQVAREHPEI